MPFYMKNQALSL